MNTLTTNNLWMMLCTALVFLMHLGFTFLEIGLTRQKNTMNILFKNIFIITTGLLLYCLVGFSFMYPGFSKDSLGIIGFAGWGLQAPLTDGVLDLSYNENYTYWTDFLFQGMFAATAATIVSGAVAERMKLEPFILFTILYVGCIYPIAGSWKWGDGFLNRLETPFYDFAGSTLVHSVGGWAALVAVWLLGPRIGKFKNGKSMAIPGHNLPMATAGVLLLWFGWFGFNGGSVLSADPSKTSLTLVTTSLAAASGGLVAFLITTFRYKYYDLPMFLNGILGGLVAITAGADVMSPSEAIAIGAVAGGLIVMAVLLIDSLQLDDPVGAIAVHLICGVWGTLAVGIVGDLASWKQFTSQLLGVASYALVCIVSSFAILKLLKIVIGLRVSEKEEREGLDKNEHGINAYPEFRLND